MLLGDSIYSNYAQAFGGKSPNLKLFCITTSPTFLYKGCSLDNTSTHRSDIFQDWFGLVKVVATCKNCQDILRIKTVE